METIESYVRPNFCFTN